MLILLLLILSIAFTKCYAKQSPYHSTSDTTSSSIATEDPYTAHPISTSMYNFFSRLFNGKNITDTSFSPDDSVTSIPLSSRSKLVIAGKLFVEGLKCNIAQLDLASGDWSLSERIQLNLYNSYAGGEVFHLLANHTIYVGNDESQGWTKKEIDAGGEELIVVGAFDTTYQNSQVTYCSVGKWNGSDFSKVGEGLCNSALSRGMKITTAALAGPQDVYVAGSFHTQVWNGDMHQFVQIFNVAHYNAVDKVWMPLPIGQIDCSWCTVTILALAWDSKRAQLHIAGKFNSINGRNIPAGLAIYDYKSRRLVAHPGGGLCMINVTEDGVGTSLQLDEESDVLYVMGSFERLTATLEFCFGIAAYELSTKRWTCLADPDYAVLPLGGGNMLLTPYGLMVSGVTTNSTTWKDPSRPYAIALLNATLLKQDKNEKGMDSKINEPWRFDGVFLDDYTPRRIFEWGWLPGFPGHHESLHVLSNGFAELEGTVFIGGDDYVAKWGYEKPPESSYETSKSKSKSKNYAATANPLGTPKTTNLLKGTRQGSIYGSVMTMNQLNTPPHTHPSKQTPLTTAILIYFIILGSLVGMLLAITFTRKAPLLSSTSRTRGISLATLMDRSHPGANVTEAYQRAMANRFVLDPHFITLIKPEEIILHRIIGEGTFGRVWSAKWRSSSVAVKEFVFAQAALAGNSCMQKEIIEEIIGEAGMMAMLRHPHFLQLYGCSLTAQAIWIVSELCSLGSLRQVLDNNSRELSVEIKLKLALHVAEGMDFLHTQDPPIIHRDLKSHNIFVQEIFTNNPETSKIKDGMNDDSNSSSTKSKYGAVDNITNKNNSASESCMVAKIGDWGSARATLSGSRTMTHGVGTACWLAPEVINHTRSSAKSDVYSFGIVLWELATRDEVYQGLEAIQIIASVANDDLRPEVPEGCPWGNLMEKCWDRDPDVRPTFKEIVDELTRILT